jgi:hypothetical protein
MKITKSEINNCLICLEKINYYYNFDCNCKNYIHTKCINHIINTKYLDKCFFCKKNIKKNYSTFDLDFINFNILNKLLEYLIIDYFFMKLFDLSKKNIIGLVLYFIFSNVFFFTIIIPGLLLNLIYYVFVLFFKKILSFL